MNMNQAIACALIVNELVSNALKYAFPDGRTGRVQVELRPLSGRRLVLVVSDDGVEGLSQALSRFLPDRSLTRGVRAREDQLPSAQQRNRQPHPLKKIDAETGDDVEQASIIKGYEVAKDNYIEITPDELEAVAIESKRTIEIEQFVPRDQIDELYIRDPHYIAPDGEVGQQAFAVIREAIRKEGMVAVGKVVFTSREHIIALEARDNGMLGVTLRYPYELRKQAGYFDDIPDEKVQGHA
jgi:Ku protein